MKSLISVCLRNSNVGALVGGTAGALLGDLVGSTTSIATGSVLGGVTGAVIGDSLGRSSGSLSLKRNVVSDIRPTPASSQAFVDDSFTYRFDCINQPLSNTTVKIDSTIPVNVSN